MPDNIPTPPPATTTGDATPLLTHAGTLTAGAAVGGAISTYWGPISEFLTHHASQVDTTWKLLAILAGCGAVGGGINSYLAGTGIVLPSLRRIDGRLTLFPGFLGNLLAGALSAIVTVWLGTPGDPVRTDATAEPSNNVLTGTMLASAVAAGLGGSRIVTGKRDTTLLLSALGQSASAQNHSQTETILNSKASVPEVFVAATGHALPGVNPARATPEPPKGLTSLGFDSTKLKEHLRLMTLVGAEPAVGPDGSGLRLEVLNELQDLDPKLRDQVKDLRLMEVGARGLKEFLSGLTIPPGMETAAAPTLASVWMAARDAKTRVERIPADAPLKL